MGEIAEMMLDGTLCAGCGVYLEGDGEGIPRYCSKACRINCGDGANIKPNRVRCQTCGKQFWSRKARRQHQANKHGRTLLSQEIPQ